MSTDALIKKIKASISGAVLNVGPFGRTGQASIWVESQAIHRVAKAIRDDQEASLDWLENLSAMEMDKAIVLTYFARSSTKPGSSLILRVSTAPESASAETEVPSVGAVWPMAIALEREISDLFGVKFEGNRLEGRFLVPEAVSGYPLRKSFTLAIRHERGGNA